jgi:hypothetical protein
MRQAPSTAVSARNQGGAPAATPSAAATPVTARNETQ